VKPDLEVLQKRLVKPRIYPNAKPAKDFKELKEKLLAAASKLDEQKIQELRPLLPEAELAGLYLRMAAAVNSVV
jgi:hypothetical protein